MPEANNNISSAWEEMMDPVDTYPYIEKKTVEHAVEWLIQ